MSHLYFQVDYSALLQSTQVLSQPAHFVESQHSSVHSFVHSSAFSHSPQHSVAAASSAHFVLLLHAHDAARNIAVTTANDINTFFIVTKKLIVTHNNIRQNYCLHFKITRKMSSNTCESGVYIICPVQRPPCHESSRYQYESGERYVRHGNPGLRRHPDSAQAYPFSHP